MFSPAPPHVVVVCHAWYTDLIGGSFRLASEFAVHLAARGCAVSYVCCSPDDRVMLETVEAGVRICRYPPPHHAWGRMRKLWHHISQTQKIVQRIHQTHPLTAVSSHSPLQGLGAARAVRHSPVTINYTVHSPFDEEIQSHHTASNRSLSRAMAVYVARWVDFQNVRLAHIVQTDSHYTQQSFRKKFGTAMGSRGVTAPGWVQADVFVPAADRTEFRTCLGPEWTYASPIFFTLRRLENRMGLDTLVESSRILRQRGFEFRVLIGGSGSLKETLRAQISESGLENEVFLLGRLSEQQLPLAYASADCFVLPTRALECFGLIVLEAFACNTPVIAANVAAIPELAEQQGTGWMFDPGNAEQLADRMQAFLEKRLQPTVDLRAIAMEYDMAKVLTEWERILFSSPQAKD